MSGGGRVIGRGLATAVLALALAGCGTDAGTVGLTPTSTGPTSTTAVPTTAVPTTAVPTTAVPTTAVPTTGSTPPDPTPVTLDLPGDPMIEFAVTVDEEIDLDRDELARFVAETLTDPRSWSGRGVGFRLVEDGGLFTIIVAAPDRVDELCAPLRTVGQYSCARNGWIAFNSLRWFGATEEWPADLDTYRRYLVNHEVGHYVQGPAHDSCPGPGLPAPIMMQQTKGLDGCEPNGWVDPTAAE